MTRHVLISGASIAGPALAHQLVARGWRVTVVERAPRLRDEGHNIDVRGAGREVARRMGIEDDIRAAGTHEVGMRFVDGDGRAVASFPVDGSAGDGPTAELEILRGELSRVLYEHTRDRVEYRFGAGVEALDDRGDRVRATLTDGTTADADLVVVAEGLRSRTRDLVLPGVNVHELGMYMAYLTVARRETDDRWWNWYHVPGARGVHLRPDNLGTTRALLTFLSDVRGLEALDHADQVAILRATFADAGGAAPRILAELDDAPLYFDSIGQAVAPRWSVGRVVLLGDSAFCVSPIGGGSTSLALIGAHVLAGELAVHDDHRAAFARYEERLRPLVEAARGTPPRVGIANPRTARGIRALRAAAAVAASRPVQRLGGLLGRHSATPAIEAFALPEYPDVTVAS